MPGGGTAAAINQRSTVVGGAAWTSSTFALDRWLAASKTGDRFIYAHGETLLDPKLGEYVRLLAAREEVRMRRDRAGDGLFDYYVIRNRVRVVQARPARGPVLDAATNGLLLKLKAVARAGQRCPSDRELAAAVGLERNQVSWCFRKLRELKIITTQIVATASEPKFRIVTIVSSGLSTWAPPKVSKT